MGPSGLGFKRMAVAFWKGEKQRADGTISILDLVLEFAPLLFYWFSILGANYFLMVHGSRRISGLHAA